MTWHQIFGEHGLHWERILSKEGPNGKALYSIRIGKGFRAVVYRANQWMSFLTLHLDHDSTYQ